MSNEIEINTYLQKLIRKNEAGDLVNFLTFGKEIFKQVENEELKNNNGIGYYQRSETPDVCRKILHTRELSVDDSSANNRKKWSFIDQARYN